MCFVLPIFFFFSSRRRHTRCLSDWSSDVCSSDLASANQAKLLPIHHGPDLRNQVEVLRRISSKAIKLAKDDLRTVKFLAGWPPLPSAASAAQFRTAGSAHGVRRGHCQRPWRNAPMLLRRRGFVLSLVFATFASLAPAQQAAYLDTKLSRSEEH